MILERVELQIKAGQTQSFEQAMRQGGQLLLTATGCQGVSLSKGVENPSRYLLILEWESIDHHTAFTKTVPFCQFREIAGPFFAERPAMEHFAPVNIK